MIFLSSSGWLKIAVACLMSSEKPSIYQRSHSAFNIFDVYYLYEI